ncbi:GDYXXLXY domain-containing protein [Bordetella sp. 2513F-2]
MQVGTYAAAGREARTWHDFLAQKTLWLGVLLTGSGVICAVAANWSALDKFQRFALAQGLLAAIVLAAAWATLRLRAGADTRRHVAGAMLALAGVVLGALLALLGQTYQTGADAWELYAWWALLLLPWAMAAASQPVWLLWVLVVNLAAALWLGERTLPGWLMFASLGAADLLIAALNLALLAAWEFAVHRWQVGTRVGPRVLAGLAVGVLVSSLTLREWALQGLGARTGVAWLAVTLGLGYFYQRVRRDLVILAMLAAGVICVSLRLAGEWLIALEPGIWTALPLAGLLMAQAAWAARWLRRLAAEPRPGAMADPEPAGPSAGVTVEPEPGAPQAGMPPAASDGRAPWYVHGLLGLSAWLATLLLLLFLAISGIVVNQQEALVTGLVLCAAGVAVLRGQTGPFWRQCATAMGFAGQLLIVFGIYDAASMAGACLFVLLIAIVVYAWCADTLLRFLSGLLMALGGTGLVWWALAPSLAADQGMLELMLRNDVLRAAFVWTPVAVVTAWSAAISFYLAHRPVAGRRLPLEPLGWALALAVQAMAWLASGVPLPQWPALWALHPPAAASNAAAALLPAVAALAVLRRQPAMPAAALQVGVPLALLALALLWLPSPGIAFALTWMLLGFGLGLSRLRAFGVLSLLAYLGFYYYQLDVPLLQKALWLGAAGLLLLFLRVLLRRSPRRAPAAGQAPAPQPPGPAAHRRVAIALAGLCAALAAANASIWQHERLLESGRVVILELAPSDPRSLMQGDYMALRFTAGRDLAQYRDAPVDGYLVLAPDARGVARTVRVQDAPQPHAPGEIPLRYRARQDGVRIVTDAYFFPEGRAAHYAQARYGELRVDADGTGLLVRMLGPDLQPL